MAAHYVTETNDWDGLAENKKQMLGFPPSSAYYVNTHIFQEIMHSGGRFYPP